LTPRQIILNIEKETFINLSHAVLTAKTSRSKRAEDCRVLGREIRSGEMGV
jgi:hypothetical protein